MHTFCIFQIPARSFYRQSKNTQWVAPETSQESDLDIDDEVEDDVQDPDFIASISDGDSDDMISQPPSKKSKVSSRANVSQTLDMDIDTDPISFNANQLEWKVDDIASSTQQEYLHAKPISVLQSFEYFEKIFSNELVDHIVYETNLYAKQLDVNTSFNTNRQEIMNLVGMILYMGVVNLPAIRDYWNTFTRISQVADVMSSTRFK